MIAKVPIDIFEQVESVVSLTPDEYADQTQKQLKLAYEMVELNTQARMDKAKTLYDRKIRPSTFKKGDFVYKVDDAVKAKTANAFLNKRKGPYVIHDQLSESVYIIKPVTPGTREKENS
jgi:hypothetical protein